MKQLLFLTIALAATQAKAQLNTSIAGTNKGAAWYIGYLAQVHQFELDIQAGIRGSRQAQNPFIGSLSIGVPLYVTEELVITPAGGYAVYQIQPSGKESTDKGATPYGAVEFGWERIMNDGGRSCLRLFATAQYCKTTAFGIGLRAFFR